jgi:biopolymer transport protein ExbD
MKQFQALCLTVLTMATIASAQTPTLQRGISVQLPTAVSASAVPDVDKNDALIVSVTQDGSVYLGTEPVNPSGLTQKLRAELETRPKKDLYIKADARTPYASVVAVLDGVHAAGFEGLTLLTNQQDGAKPETILSPKGLAMLVVQAHHSR